MRFGRIQSGSDCGYCSEDNTNDYLELRISNLRKTMHGENKDEVFDLNAFYSPVGGNWPCVSGNSWYWQWIYNFAYGAYQKLLIYRVSDRWVIRREGGSATFAYCLEAQLDKCNNQWYVEYGVDSDGNTAYMLDSDGSFECISNEFCNQPITTTGATTDDYETSNSEEGCAINDENDCVDVRGFWGNLWTVGCGWML